MTTLNWKPWGGKDNNSAPVSGAVVCMFSNAAVVLGVANEFTWDRPTSAARNSPYIVAWRTPTQEERMQLRSNDNVMFTLNTVGNRPAPAELKWNAWSGDSDVEGIKVKGTRLVVVELRTDSRVYRDHYVGPAKAFNWIYDEGAATVDERKVIAWRFTTAEEGALWNLANQYAMVNDRGEFADPRIATLRTLHQIRDGQRPSVRSLGGCADLKTAIDNTPKVSGELSPQIDTSASVDTETKELFSSADGPDGMGEHKPREMICKVTIHDNRASEQRFRAAIAELDARRAAIAERDAWGRRSAKGGDTCYQSCLREMMMSRSNRYPLKQADLEQARTSAEFLSTADSTINQRGKDYDQQETGERSGGPVAIAFNALTGKSITAAEVYLIQQLLKDRRQWSAPEFHYDSALDSVAFAALKSEALANENKERS